MKLFPCRPLARWFEKNKRALPWRRNQDPYRVWISEIMLQQTQVDNVIPYYKKFLKRFPNLQALARSSEQGVLSLWSGLGYYSRARNLLKCARTVANAHGGYFPNTPEKLLELPGIGPYTAGALASIAFDLPSAIYDGNVRRVLSRFFLSRDDSALRIRSQDLVSQAHRSGIKPSVFNQALMELGALVCAPRNPLCGGCPLKRACGAKINASQNLFPERVKSPASIRKFYALAILTSPAKKNHFLVVRRSQSDLWLKGLWEFPMVSLDKNPEDASLRDMSKIFKERLKISPGLQTQIGNFKHSITHHQLCVSVYSGKTLSAPAGSRWVRRADLGRLSSSSMLAKSLALHGRIL